MRIRKWDGTTWTAQTSGTSQSLRAVGGTSATDLWAVGGGGTVLKGDGSTWTPRGSGTTTGLLGLWFGAANNMWVSASAGLLLQRNP